VAGLSGTFDNQQIHVWNNRFKIDQLDSRSSRDQTYVGDQIGGFDPVGLFVAFRDYSETALSDPSLPGPLELADFPGSFGRIDVTPGLRPDRLDIAFLLTEATFTVVPVPPAMALLATGFGVLGFATPRRRPKRDLD